ncbi:lamin tail domain-containing protein [Niallia sp. RD1]|uniref:lamin tail domain-containing protein n=1 Tax=Niallia sp. RD1 TaxID=2962858 RepID=UPI0020C19491|nr:lamin tail domain-containing protein [Niallia sp. RD1]UTI42763.1 lamin tail domain-containing protein [Niallia sp. RD1]
MSLKKRIARRAFVVFVIGVFFFSTYFPAFPGLTIYAAERTGEKVDESTLTTETDSTLEASETEATTVEQEQEVTNEEEKAHLEEEESSSSKQEEPVTKEENKQQENDVKEEKTEEKAEEPLTEIEQEQEENQQETIDYAKLPPLLITELAPDSQGTDNFEFIELYNNTNQPIDLNSYYFYYHYIGGSTPDKIMSIPATTIAPQQSIVLWFNVKDLKIEDFNKHFSTSLTEHQVISFKGDFPGFANGGNRGVVIKNLDGQEVVSATYSSGETDNTGLDVHYAFPTEGTEMVKQQVKASPTPAVLGDGQVPTEPLQENPKGEDTEAPVITHEAKTTAKGGEAISFEATIVDDHKNPSAILYYQVEPDQIYKAIEMQQDSANPHKFTANIPKEAVQGNIAYYLEATDNKNIAKTSTYTIELEKEEAPEPADTYSDRPLLITELAPNSIGGGTDYYEYFELYNNSNQTLNLAAYSFYYVYTDLSREPVLFPLPPAAEMKSKEKLVFWFNNGDKTLEDFNKEYGTNLTSNEVVMFTDKAFPGFANGGNRALEIKDSDGKVMISASYLGSENDNDGKVVHYQFPHEGMEMAKYKVLADPSPGTIEANQVPTDVVELPEVPKDTEPPVISHNPIQTAKAFTAMTIEAIVTDNEVANPIVTLFYKKSADDNFKSLAMSKDAQGRYSISIPAAEVDGEIVYYIVASDGINESKTEEYNISVEETDIDFTKIPKLLVTEVVPDSANVGTADGYEYVEIYNNTDKAINFKDYKIQYRYNADPATDVIWPSIPDDVVIEPQKTLVFWIINAQNGEMTVADFNANYGTSLVENKDIVRIKSDGMANGSMRGLVIATNTKEEINVAYYNDEATQLDTAMNMGILYKFPEDGSTQSVKISAKTKLGTPGTVEPTQVPAQPVHVEDDTVPPTLTNATNIQEINQNDDVTIRAKATDDKGIKSVVLYYRTNDQADYEKLLLTVDPSDIEYYVATLYAANFIAKESIEYYFVATDGQNEVTSEKYVIHIKNDSSNEPIHLNVKEDDILSGNVILKATSKENKADDVELFVDGKKVEQSSYSSLESQAYLAVDISGLNMYFKNAITMGDEIIYLLDKDNNSDWKTFTIPIDPNKLSIGENIITVRSGNKASPFQLDESEENRDDYNLRNVRLILADGTVIRDPKKANPVQVFDMGDDGTYRPFEDFTFTITEEQAKAKTYLWETTAVADGAYSIKAADKENEVTATVKVDNTAPVMKTNMEANKEYKGAFAIEASAVDGIAGVESLEVTLDDEKISVPFDTASSKLAPGTHDLKMVAVDKAGNKAETVISFSVTNENPNKPELIAPANNAATAVDGDPALKVKVTDPTEDSMDVTYYKGYKYEAKDSQVKSFENASDTEPPVELVPAGEKALTAEDVSAISSLDGKYLTTDSSTQFPYHRFEVELDSSIDEQDQVELVWNGKSLEGRKVSMYAWSIQENKWKLLTYKIARAEDFALKADVHISEFADVANKINVLIQDEIPSSPDEYDYTFVWMSDTQYYSESYPYIYKRQTEWIAEKQEEMKIKYVLHTGDVVDESDDEQQWLYADEYMRVLEDNGVPYGVLAGNHDVDQLSNDYTEFSKWFGEDRFKDQPHYGESYKDNRGHYDLISAGGNDFIMIYMGWGVNDEDMQWINDVLKQYPDRKAILNFHEYLLVSGNRSPIGEEIFQKVVEKNENVFLVLSGHYHDSETLISEVDDDQDGIADRKVYQMLGDYQGGPEGGQGYMKLLHFDQKNNRIVINTYSPYLDDYNFYEPDEYPLKDELVIDFDLTVQEKQVATDYFAVNVYTNEEIGQQENVASGDTSEVVWKNLEEGQTYDWYVIAADNYTGTAISDIWSFTKGQPAPEVPSEPGDGDGEDGGSEDPTIPNPDDNDGGSEDPTIPNLDDNDGGSEDPTIPNPDGNGEGKDPSKDNTNQSGQKDNQSSILPNTATANYTIMLVGIVLLIVGMVIVSFRRIRKEA